MKVSEIIELREFFDPTSSIPGLLSDYFMALKANDVSRVRVDSARAEIKKRYGQELSREDITSFITSGKIPAVEDLVDDEIIIKTGDSEIKNKEVDNSEEKVRKMAKRAALKEAKLLQVDAYGKRIKVHQNPSYKEVKYLINVYEYLRGSFSDGNVYLWSAYDANHDDVRTGLGLSFDYGGDDFDFYISKYPESNRGDSDWNNLREIEPEYYLELYGFDFGDPHPRTFARLFPNK